VEGLLTPTLGEGGPDHQPDGPQPTGRQPTGPQPAAGTLHSVRSQSLGTVAWRAAEDLEFMTWPIFDGLDVDVAMTTREGGVSTGPYSSLNLALHVGDEDDRVVENRRRAARMLDARLDDFVFCNQTHGARVLEVTAADRGRGTTPDGGAPEGIDAVVTRSPGTVLAMMVADCVPIALYDPHRHVAAAVHAGWRGTVLRVAGAAVASMVGLGSSPPDIVAAIGPACAPDSYQVGEDVKAKVEECFGAAAADVLRPDGDTEGRYLFDLWGANARVLLDTGLHPEHIVIGGVATGGDGPFFSDRAERPCGRNAILVRLRPQS
jgi:polyphenol oxidase